MIDIRSLVAVQWDYLPEVADAGMTPAYQAHLMAHPFPRFTDPAGMGRQAQRQGRRRRQRTEEQAPQQQVPQQEAP